MKTAVIAALGSKQLNQILRGMEDIEVAFEAVDNFELKERSTSSRITTILSSDNLENAINTLLLIKRENPKLRIIYFCKPLSKNDGPKLKKLKEMYKEKIYDIVFTDEITETIIRNIIRNPRGSAAMSILGDSESNTKGALSYSNAHKMFPGELENLTVFMSLKPGSGKSYLAVNTACAIADKGINSPRVALIEADIETPSIGTALAIDKDNGQNIKNALDKISTLFNGNNLLGTEKEQEVVQTYIRNCFVRYDKISNLYVLQGTSLMPEDISKYKALPSYYMYLLNTIKNDFDVIIVDVNSSLLGTATYPFLNKAKNIICTLTMDANSIRQTLKYRSFLTSHGLDSKIKWVMTKALDNSKEFNGLGTNIEKLVFTSADFDQNYFKVDYKIPAIPETVFINHLYNGDPIIFDNKPYTKNTRQSMLELANDLHPLNLEEEKKKKSFFKR